MMGLIFNKVVGIIQVSIKSFRNIFSEFCKLSEYLWTIASDLGHTQNFGEENSAEVSFTREKQILAKIFFQWSFVVFVALK